MQHITSSTLPNIRASDYVDGYLNQICVGDLVEVQFPAEVFDTVPIESRCSIELGVQVEILWGADREDIEAKGLAGFKLSERAISCSFEGLLVSNTLSYVPVVYSIYWYLRRSWFSVLLQQIVRRTG